MREQANGAGEHQDFWGAEDFEETVATTLIACFETRVKKNRGAAPTDRLTDERLALMRVAGPYIVSKSRLILAPPHIDGRWVFDTTNDPLPISGCLATRPKGILAESMPGAFMSMVHIRRTDSLGRYWRKRRTGVLYEMLTAGVNSDGVHGERRYFTVAASGEVVACDQTIVSGSRCTTMGSRSGMCSHGDQFLHETEIWATVVLQLLADRHFCWTITAQEKSAHAHLGCMQEEVKSLLYARSLPMTATGRKRPILHLVESHRRRLKNGTDVDVSAFLRGQHAVEIGDTVFRINPPASIKANVSMASRKRFFDQPFRIDATR